mgnify:CR=1 FL=1
MRLQNPPNQKRGYILVKLTEQDGYEKTKSGILIPKQAEDSDLFRKAEVVDVGADRPDYTMETKVGDVILVKTLAIVRTDAALFVDEVPHYILREDSGFYGWVND